MLLLTGLLYLLGLGFLPFFFWEPAPIAFEVPKVWASITWIIIVTLSFLLTQSSVRRASFFIKESLLYRILLVFFLIKIAASFLGVDIVKSIAGNHYRIDGLLTQSALIALSLITATLLTKTFFIRIVQVLTISTTLLSIWTVLSYIWLHLFHMPVANWSGAIGVSFGQPNFLAGYLLVTLPLLWYWIQKAETFAFKGCLALLLIGQCAAIGATYSLASSAGIALFFFFLVTKKVLSYKKWLIVCLISTLLCVIGFWSISILKDQTTFVPESRHRIYTYLWQSAHTRPFLGWGVANVDRAFESVSTHDGYLHDVLVDKAHAEFLEILVTTGLLGLASYALLLAMTWKILIVSKPHSLQNENFIMQMSFLLFLFHSQTNVLSISEYILFWIMIGFALFKESELEQ